MKKYLIFMSVALCFLCIPLKADTSNVKYKLYLDSKISDSYKIKEEVLTIIDYLCEGLDDTSYEDMIKDNLDLFKKIKDSKVSFKKHTLYIKVGDAQGMLIQGEYEKRNVCFEKVEVESAILEIFE